MDNAPEVSFRGFRPGDGAGVSALLREYYHDDYFDAACYDTEYLEKACEDGRRLIYVAVSPVDGIVGTVDAAYRAYFPDSYELGLHILRKAYQGRGLGRRLLAYCVAEARRMRIHGVYGMAVCHHDRSQRECEAIGLPATGLWLGRHSAERAFFEGGRRSSKLHSVVVAGAGAVLNNRVLYAPESHRAFIRERYERLGLSVEFGESGGRTPPASSMYIRNAEEAAKNRDIYVRSPGLDFAARLDRAMLDCPPDTGYTVFLNMLVDGCAGAYAWLVSRGFYFTGVHPLHGGGEYLMAHREGGGEYAWDEAELTPANRLMLDYVLEHRGL